MAGSKIADKSTSLKVSEKEKPQEIESEQQEIIIPPHQRQDIIDDFKIVLIKKMGYKKIKNLLGMKDIRFKAPQLRNDLCGFNDAYIVLTGNITTTSPGNENNVYNK